MFSLKKIKESCRPHLWYQLYWLLYIVWFFALDLTVKNPKYLVHCSLDDKIPFCEWFVFPYSSWFLLLVGVFGSLWWFDTDAYDKLCLTCFSGMTFCLICYMLFPSGLTLRPDPSDLGRSNPALWILSLIWKADASVNVCPSIHCQSSVCMAKAFSYSTLARQNKMLPCVAWGWAALICLSTVFTKQHSVVDVVCGLAVAAVFVLPVYGKNKRKR